MPVPIPTKEQGALVRRRRELLERLASPELRGADQVLVHAERNRAQTGSPVTARELAAYRRQRSADLAANLPLEHERNLRAAGIEPARLATADDAGRAALLEQVKRHVSRERELLAAIPEPAQAQAAGRPALRVDHQAFRDRVAAARAHARRERRLARAGRTRSRK